jgi:hypothetical protein
MCCRKLITLRHVALSKPVIVVALPLIRLEVSVRGGGRGAGEGMVSCHDSPWALSQTAIVVAPPPIGL